jgi:hypothetical protein
VTDHGVLTGLEDDDHLQYVHRGSPVVPPHAHADEHLIRPKIEGQHNDDPVARREAIDFQDGQSVVFRVEDDILPAGAIAHYKMDEATGTRDERIAGRDLGESGGAVGSGVGPAGAAALFTGGGAYLDVAAFPALSRAFSVSVWMKPQTTGRQALGLHDASATVWNTNFAFAWNAAGTQLTAYVADGTPVTGWTFATAVTSGLDRWYHCVLTYDQGGDKLAHLWVDGVEYVAAGALPGSPYALNLRLRVGILWSVVSPYIGLANQLSIYERVLTSAEIARLRSLAVGGRMLVSASVPAGAVIPAAHFHAPGDIPSLNAVPRGARVAPEAHAHVSADVADLRPDDSEWVIAQRMFGG